MYRKVIPEVLRQKTLKARRWRLKWSAQLLLNDSLAGQWNATSGDSGGAELLAGALLGLPAGSGCEPSPVPLAAPGCPGRHSRASAGEPRALHETRNCTESAAWGKWLFLDTHIFCVACILAVCLLLRLTIKLQKHVKPSEFWLGLRGEKGKII